MKAFLRQYEVTSFDGKESWRELMEEKLRDKPNFYPVFFQKIIRLDPVSLFLHSNLCKLKIILWMGSACYLCNSKHIVANDNCQSYFYFFLHRKITISGRSKVLVEVTQLFRLWNWAVVPASPVSWGRLGIRHRFYSKVRETLSHVFVLIISI